jgi:hypothetical protein
VGGTVHPGLASWGILSRPLRQAQGRLCRTDCDLGGDSPTAHLLVPKVKLQVPPLRYPEFPVRLAALANFMRLFLRKAAYVALDGTAMEEIQVRSGRDDKFKGGGTPWHGWKWMDRVKRRWAATTSRPCGSQFWNGRFSRRLSRLIFVGGRS